MRTEAIRPFYTKNEIKREIKSAAVSAGLSAGLTLMANKGKNPMLAAKTGGIMAGISILLGIIQKAVSNKNNQ